MRIAVGCIGHETNSFSPVPTTMAHFEQGSYYAGPAVLDAFAGTSTITGGFIDGAGDLGVELVPLLWTFATPSGVVEQATYDSLKARFMQLLQEAGPLDGVCLDLHGAMVSEAHEDAEGDLLASVRRAIGPMPLISTLDLHANITACMAAQVEALVGFDTYPHVDCYERGLEAIKLMHAQVEGRIRLTQAYRQLPLLTAPPAQCDGTHILRALIESDFEGAVVAVIADPESVEQAIAAGVGQEVDLQVGGKTIALHGEPVAVRGYVETIADGRFVLRGPMGRGKSGSMGRTAVVAVGGIEIVLTEERVQPFDAEVLRCVGITPERCKLIALKSAVHFRADYTPIAHEILEVDTPGVHSPNLFSYDYKKLRRPIFPLDQGTGFA